MIAESTQNALSAFNQFEEYLNGESKSKLHGLRKEAIERFKLLGFPKSSVEEWKYTKTDEAARFSYEPQSNGFDKAAIKKELEAERVLIGAEHCLVMVNGIFCPKLSSHNLGEKVFLGNLKDCFQSHPSCVQKHYAQGLKTDKNGLLALNTAFMTGGLFICVEKNTSILGQVHIISLSTATKKALAFCPRILMVLGENSSLDLVESHLSVGSHDTLSNFAAEVVLGENAHIKHVRISKEASSSMNIAHYGLQQQKSSSYKMWNFSLSGKLLRQEVKADLNNIGAFFSFRGLDIGIGQQHVDTCLQLNHLSGFASSAQLVKGIFQDQASGVFYGHIFVNEGADKTDALQVNKNLMLSNDAQVFTRPQLEIYADDVKCNHGSSIGKIDDKALFYLQARGIPKEAAKLMMAQAFVEEVFDGLDAKLVKVLKKIIKERLAHA